MHCRRGFALLMTLLLIVLLMAGAAELATVTSTEAVAASRRHHDWAHQKAVDSALLVLAEELRPDKTAPSDLIAELDRQRVARRSFPIGEVQVECTVGDDATKFNPLLFQRDDEQRSLTRKLTLLAQRNALPETSLALRPWRVAPPVASGRRYRWYDQLLSDPQPGTLFRWNEEKDPQTVWSDLVTFWGEGRIDLRRVDADVLEVLLEDLRPGLGKALLAARPPPKERSLDFTQTALIAVPAELRAPVAARMTFDARRYALRIDTVLNADRRRWYVVAHIRDGKSTVLHRSAITW